MDSRDFDNQKMFGLKVDDHQFQRFADFYHGKSVFLTGAAGFVGVVLLETLLRCCPGIESIYILLRSKKNLQPEDRKEEIFSRKIFEKLKQESPEALEKVHVLKGDVSLPKLGMQEDDMQLLIDEVSVVFHCAAIINFTKPLEFMLLNNVRSVNTVIELCRQMKKFEALVYTSTIFSNASLIYFPIQEEIFRLPIHSEKFLDALKNEEHDKLQELIARCNPDWPNSYTFSKRLAENVIMDTASDLPVAIIRPSAVVSTWKNPFPGYIEENSGLMALLLGVGKGFIKVVYANPNHELNCIPVDIVANSHVIAAWSVATGRCVSPFIVNCTATENLKIHLSKHIQSFMQLVREFPLPLSFDKPTRWIIEPNRYLYSILAIYYHYIPAVFLDGWLRILGKKPRIFSLYRFLDRVLFSLTYFMSRNFDFERKNIEVLNKLIQDEDINDLSLDFRDANALQMSKASTQVSRPYDWKIDRKSKSERLRTVYRRHLLITCIQWMFLLVCSLIIYWAFSYAFR